MKTSLFIKTLSGEPAENIPFWLMRQAGRYLPEYRALREKAGSFLDLCFNPKMAAEVTLQPLRRFDMDAAILFSDILVVPYALGQTLAFAEGEGPQLGEFKRVEDFIKKDFKIFHEKLSPVYETIRCIKKDLSADKALIGFAGAPWTIACYMIQGSGGGEFLKTRKFASEKPEEFGKLMDFLAEATSSYLIEQIRSGVEAVQIFDSWAGLLAEKDFDRWAILPVKKIVENIHKTYPGFPIIGFPRGAGKLYSIYSSLSCVSCVGIDQSFSIETAVRDLNSQVVLQGNLDPEILLKGGSDLEKETLHILKAAGGRPFIFNLGHGIIKETPPEHVTQLSKIIKDFKK